MRYLPHRDIYLVAGSKKLLTRFQEISYKFITYKNIHEKSKGLRNTLQYKGGRKTEKHIYTKNYVLSFYFCDWGQNDKSLEIISLFKVYLKHIRFSSVQISLKSLNFCSLKVQFRNPIVWHLFRYDCIIKQNHT